MERTRRWTILVLLSALAVGAGMLGAANPTRDAGDDGRASNVFGQAVLAPCGQEASRSAARNANPIPNDAERIAVGNMIGNIDALLPADTPCAK